MAKDKSKKKSDKKAKRKSEGGDEPGESQDPVPQDDADDDGSDGDLRKQRSSKKDKRSKKDKSKRKKNRSDGDAKGKGKGDSDGENESTDAEDKKKTKKQSKKSSKKKKSGSPKKSSRDKAASRDDFADGPKAASDRVTIVKDEKETFAELQARKAANLLRCRWGLCSAAILGICLIIVGAGLLIAFAYIGRCSDPTFPNACSSFECCSTGCSVPEPVCELVIVSPLEAAGIALHISGWLCILTVLICFAQVSRMAALSVPSSIFGYLLVASIVLLVASLIGFVVAALAQSGVIADDPDSEAVTSLEDGFWIFALTTIWPAVILFAASMAGLYVGWKSKRTAKAKTILVVGLGGSGKSHIVDGLVSAAEKQQGAGRSGVVQNMGGRPTKGLMMQAVTRSDGYCLRFFEPGDVPLMDVLRYEQLHATHALCWFREPIVVESSHFSRAVALCVPYMIWPATRGCRTSMQWSSL